jgi:hypothetical protein
MTDFNIEIISLAGDHARKRFQEAQMLHLGLKANFLDATTPNDFPKKVMEKLTSAWARPLRQTEVALTHSHRLCCTNRLRDSCRESSVVAGGHEQTDIADLQDHELGCLQRGAEAPRIADDLVRSQDELECRTFRQEGQIADIQ